MFDRSLKVLIINNGHSNLHVPLLINAFEDSKNVNLRVVHNHLQNTLNFFQKLFYKLRLPINLNKFNERILSALESFVPDIILIIKGNDLYPKTIKKIKSINPTVKIISWSGDHMLKKHNSSIYFKYSIPLYDIHFTSKSNAIEGLYLKGAKKVVFLNKAYYKNLHFYETNPNLKYDVIFIGSFEEPRYNSIKFLSENGITVNVFGNGWDHLNSTQNLIIHKKPLEGAKYRQAISSSKVNLHFLRKANEDFQTDRTMEIPACMGFLLAERTKEHTKLFIENEEAVFFNSDTELLQKVKYFLKNEDKRKKVAKSGFKRVTQSDYSYENMIEKIIKSCFENE